MTDKVLSITSDKEYQQWLQQLITEIDKQRLQAAMQLNAATLQHYCGLETTLSVNSKNMAGVLKSLISFLLTCRNVMAPTVVILHAILDI